MLNPVTMPGVPLHARIWESLFMRIPRDVPLLSPLGLRVGSRLSGTAKLSGTGGASWEAGLRMGKDPALGRSNSTGTVLRGENVFPFAEGWVLFIFC